MSEMQTYPLWAVRIGNDTWASRGTEEQVVEYLTRYVPMDNYCVLNYMPIDAAEKYSKNHAPGWLYCEPVHLQKERLRKHQDEILGQYDRDYCSKTVEELIDELASTVETRRASDGLKNC